MIIVSTWYPSFSSIYIQLYRVVSVGIFLSPHPRSDNELPKPYLALYYMEQSWLILINNDFEKITNINVPETVHNCKKLIKVINFEFISENCRL